MQTSGPRPPVISRGYIRKPLDHGDIVLLASFVASAATVGGGLGSGLDSDEAVRAAAYSKREEERRSRIADETEDEES